MNYQELVNIPGQLDKGVKLWYTYNTAAVEIEYD